MCFPGLHGRCEYCISVPTQAHTITGQSGSEMQVSAPKMLPQASSLLVISLQDILDKKAELNAW